MNKFHWAILGTGLAARKFVLGLRASSASEAVAVASRSFDNAQRFGKLLNIDHIHRDYREAIEDEAADGVYIATPATTHREFALMAIQAGKPVLIEKPFCTRLDEAQEIIAAARQRRVFCMEAMWTRFMPLVQRLKELVSAGELGDIRLISGSFGLAEAVDPRNPLFNPDLGGGALLDRGVYPISLTQYLLGVPDSIRAQACRGETGVDEQMVAILRYPCGALAMLYASLTTQAPNELLIMGTKAVLRVHAPLFRPFRLTLTPLEPRGWQAGQVSRLAILRESHWVHQALQRLGFLLQPLRQRHQRRLTLPYSGNGYHHEADEVVRCLAAGQRESSIMPLDDSLAVMRILDEIRAQFSATDGQVAHS